MLSEAKRDVVDGQRDNTDRDGDENSVIHIHFVLSGCVRFLVEGRTAANRGHRAPRTSETTQASPNSVTLSAKGL